MISDDSVDAAVRAFNGWPPTDPVNRRDSTWSAMRRALAAAAGDDKRETAVQIAKRLGHSYADSLDRS